MCNNDEPRGKRAIIYVVFGIIVLIMLMGFLIQGNDVALLNPKDVIAGEQRELMIITLLLLLEIAIPTLVLFFYTAWKYRESNEKVVYSPHNRHSKGLVFSIWAAPTVVMLLLASVMWPATHRLAPQKALESGTKTLKIQVIALPWKWLFIYPEQHIASINYIELPVNTPVQFIISADETPMSSFWIPHLGGQIYAMTGHVNQLNLMATTEGKYAGSTAEINGSGFAGMRFITKVGSYQDFDQWVNSVKDTPSVLDAVEYQKILKPSEYNKPAFYSQAEPDIYTTLLTKYAGTHYHNTEAK